MLDVVTSLADTPPPPLPRSDTPGDIYHDALPPEEEEDFAPLFPLLAKAVTKSYDQNVLKARKKKMTKRRGQKNKKEIDADLSNIEWFQKIQRARRFMGFDPEGFFKFDLTVFGAAKWIR